MEIECRREMERICKQNKEELDRIWKRLDKGDKTFAELRASERKQAEISIDMKKDIQHLIKQMQSLTKAIWAVVMLWFSVSIGFIMWYIQSGG